MAPVADRPAAPTRANRVRRGSTGLRVARDRGRPISKDHVRGPRKAGSRARPCHQSGPARSAIRPVQSCPPAPHPDVCAERDERTSAGSSPSAQAPSIGKAERLYAPPLRGDHEVEAPLGKREPSQLSQQLVTTKHFVPGGVRARRGAGRVRIAPAVGARPTFASTRPRGTLRTSLRTAGNAVREAGSDAACQASERTISATLTRATRRQAVRR